MASLRELRSRIRSVNSTMKITQAQELIAASRITNAQVRVAAAKPYAEEISQVLTELASASSSLDHPLLTQRPNPRRAAVLLVTADTGKCGAYNANVIREAEELISLLREQGKEPVLYVLGNKGVEYYTFRDRPLAGSWTGFSQEPRSSDALAVCRQILGAYMAGSDGEVERVDGHGTIAGVDEFHIVYTRFVSMLTQKPEVRRIGPLEVQVQTEVVQMGDDMLSDQPAAAVEGPVAGFDFEPDAETLLGNLLPRYVVTRIYAALLDAAASEHAARRTAMKAATDNAKDLANTLSRQANQARQTQITQEISEIVSGANALASSDGE